MKTEKNVSFVSCPWASGVRSYRHPRPFLGRKRGNLFVLMITDSYSKLRKAIPTESIGARELWRF